MFTKLRELLPANRLAALTGIVLAIIAFLVTINESLVPGSPAAEAIGKAIVMLGSVLAVLRIVEKFLDGSQKWDELLLGGADTKVEGENVTVVNTPGADATPIDNSLSALPDHPANTAAPNREITDDDVKAEFGTTEPLPDPAEGEGDEPGPVKAPPQGI